MVSSAVVTTNRSNATMNDATDAAASTHPLEPAPSSPSPSSEPFVVVISGPPHTSGLVAREGLTRCRPQINRAAAGDDDPRRPPGRSHHPGRAAARPLTAAGPGLGPREAQVHVDVVGEAEDALGDDVAQHLGG